MSPEDDEIDYENIILVRKKKISPKPSPPKPTPTPKSSPPKPAPKSSPPKPAPKPSKVSPPKPAPKSSPPKPAPKPSKVSPPKPAPKVSIKPIQDVLITSNLIEDIDPDFGIILLTRIASQLSDYSQEKKDIETTLDVIANRDIPTKKKMLKNRLSKFLNRNIAEKNPNVMFYLPPNMKIDVDNSNRVQTFIWVKKFLCQC